MQLHVQDINDYWLPDAITNYLFCYMDFMYSVLLKCIHIISYYLVLLKYMSE